MHSSSSASASTSSAPTYPAAPWRLRGWAVQTMHMVNIDAIRPNVPKDLRIVRIGPRHTLGCVYLAKYGSGSVLEYHEMIVLPALTWGAGRLGFWVSHIYVDLPASMAGGREVWNLPKELADFSVDDGEHGRRVTVRQDETTLATFDYQPRRSGVPMMLPLPAFGTLNGSPRFFVGQARNRLNMTKTHVEIPPESPFANLGVGRSFLGLNYANLNLLAAAPKG